MGQTKAITGARITTAGLFEVSLFLLDSELKGS